MTFIPPRPFCRQQCAVVVLLAGVQCLFSAEVASTLIEKTQLWSPLPALFWHGGKSDEKFVKQSTLKENEEPLVTIRQLLAGKLVQSSRVPGLTVGFVHDTALSSDSMSTILGGYKKNIELGNKPFAEQKLNQQSFLYRYSPENIEERARSFPSLVGRIRDGAKSSGLQVHTVSFQDAPSFLERGLQKLLARRAGGTSLVLVNLEGQKEAALKTFYGGALESLERTTGGKYSAFIVGQPSTARKSESILVPTPQLAGFSFLESSSMGELSDSVARKPIVSHLPTSPEILSGTILGLFIVWMLWIAVGCMTAIPSAPKMFQQPPGPKDGDPQYANTPFEGKRYYPFRNIPMKEF
jgi:hypothetical protein